MKRFEDAVQWVLEARRLLVSMQTENVDFSEKSGHQDIVTKYDKEIERYLRDRIRGNYPKDRIVGEEFPGEASGGEESREWWDTQQEAVWYLDPIDGTTNFVNQRCHYAISVGCLAEGEMDFGIVLDVTENRLYTAKKGLGAWMNGKRLQTSLARQVKNMLLTCPCVTDLFLEPHKRQAGFSRLALDVRAVRSLGSVALELCQVASGQADLCVAMKSSPWDHNAARLILKEAGGEIRNLEGGPLSYSQSSAFLAGNSRETTEFVIEHYL